MENLYKGLIEPEEFSIPIDDVIKLYVYTDILKIAEIPLTCQRHFNINNRLVRDYIFRSQDQGVIRNSWWVHPKDFTEDGFMIIGNMQASQEISCSEIEIALLDGKHNQKYYIMNELFLYDCSLFDDELSKDLAVFMLSVKAANKTRILFAAFYTKDESFKKILRSTSNTVEFSDQNCTLHYQNISVAEYRIFNSMNYARRFFQNKEILKNYIAVLADYPTTTFGLEVINRRSVDLFNELFQGNDPITLDDRKLFFKQVNKASGPVASTQCGSNFLLLKLKELCQILDINYWLYYGTLLGAKRHNAFIPWDDDIDVGIMREDLHKLIRYLQKDAFFGIDILYNTEWGDRVYKFRFKNADLPTYVDIFPFDYCHGDSREIWNSLKILKHDMVTDFRKLQDEMGCNYHVCFKIPEKHLTLINNLFDKYHKIANKKLNLSDKKSDMIVYGFDNVFLCDWLQVFFVNEITPLAQEVFNESSYPIFRNAEEILVRNYNAPYTLPKDIVSHRHTARMTEDAQNKLYDLMSSLKNYKFN